MKSVRLLSLGILLAACDTASPAFRDVPAQRITIGKSSFDVRVKDSRAEALRLNAEWAPRLDAVAGRATMAIETVSGCKVKRLYGDQAMVKADLSCQGRPAPPPPRGPLYCEPDGPAQVIGEELVYEITCEVG